MVVRDDSACPRCGGPALHPGVCADGAGEVYPLYAELARVWQEQGRPPLSGEEVAELQESVRLSLTNEE